MRLATRDVVVTGMGVVCSVAHDCEELLAAVECGRSGIATITRFDTSAFDVHLGAEVKEAGFRTCGESPDPTELCRAFARRAAMEALHQAARVPGLPPPERIAVVFGTGLVDARLVHELARELAAAIGAGGPCVVVSTACSSSTGALGLGRDLIAMGSADAVLAGGADVLSPSVFAGFHALGVLSPEPCAPFSQPFGTNLGEGAGFLVLERGDAAEARGVEVLARLSGYGLSADAFHETAPHPEGAGVARAISSALEDSGLGAGDVGYVNAHGSGTEANDPSEWRGIERVLGTPSVPVSSTKGALGHAQGAAGALECIVTIQSMRRSAIAPTLNFVGPRRFAPPDPVGGVRPRRATYEHALCLNSAFGGSNAAVVFSKSVSRPAPPRSRRTLEVHGLGMVGPYGLGVRAFEKMLPSGMCGRVPPFDLNAVVRRADPRGLDPSSRFLTAASALAFQDSGLTVSRRIGDRTGLVLGSVRPSPTSIRDFGTSVSQRGLRGLSAAAFARIVLNAPAGTCAKALALRGPHTALTGGAGSGLAAIVFAAELLGTRDDVDLMLAAAVDEHPVADDASPPSHEGAVSVLLGVHGSPHGRRNERSILVAGWAIAGPGRREAALHMARRGDVDVSPRCERVFDAYDYAGDGSWEGAVPSSMAFAHAVLALRKGECSRAVVTSDVGGSMSLAVILQSRGG